MFKYYFCIVPTKSFYIFLLNNIDEEKPNQYSVTFLLTLLHNKKTLIEWLIYYPPPFWLLKAQESLNDK